MAITSMCCYKMRHGSNYGLHILDGLICVRTCLYDGSGVRVHNTMGLRNIRFWVGYWFIFMYALNIRAFARLIYVYGRKSNKN